MKRRISVLLVLTLVLLTLTVTLIVGFNFREFAIQSSIDKAKMTATLVRDGLTAHMINDVMENRHHFMERIGAVRDLEQVWVIRADSVIRDYGVGFEGERSKDEIDAEVISSGKSADRVTETSSSAHLRVTIPYIATPECLQCHVGGRGEVLGAISMIMDISDMRESGLKTMARICIASFLVAIAAALITNQWLNRYLELFEALTKAIKKGHEGDFSPQISTSLTDEGGKLAEQLNSLYSKLRDMVEQIDKRIVILIGATAQKNANENPLIRMREIVDSLVDIYKFKKTIEIDRDKNEIYEHLIDVVRKILGENGDFALFEVSIAQGKSEVIYAVNPRLYCRAHEAQTLCEECRALRSQTVVFSDDFSRVCAYFDLENEERRVLMCMPYRVTDEVSLLLQVSSEDSVGLERIKVEITTLNNYFDAARPVLESRYLTHVLQESNLRDGLTGLYNRKFLNEFTDHIARQASRVRSSYALLALDIDHFKMVNDTYGHDIGDLVIKGLADTMTSSIREADIAIRQGGEEFLIMLLNASEEGAVAVAEKIREKFAARPFKTGAGDSISKTVSVGITLYPQDADGIWRAIKLADIALYKAKDGGRNRVVRYQSEMGPVGEAY
ncbi:MAG: diguanylate cyclase [Helicobacteraceae bacterium]|jgi:diguanylate cyclase (GGDEF)-like protein|nr:diguanylate cyclase [Helicobacteraceae bacterium]